MSKIIIADSQTSKILDHIHKYDVPDNMHERDMSNWVEVFEFTAFADKRYAQHLVDRNRLIIPDEDGEYRELIIKNTERYSGTEGVNYIDIISYGFYQDLVTAKTIEPGTTPSQSPEAHMRDILEGTEVRVGEVAYTGNIRTITRENKTDPFSALKSLANEFDLELDFRIEVDRGKIVRYADLVEHIGEWRGRTVEFGHDLQTVSRETDANNIVTALRVIGPEREDGTRLEVFVEDEDARNRWSRNGEHLVREYEPETENQNITEERLRTLGRMELNKRVNALVTWEINVIDLEHVPGMQNKKIRYGDTIRVKDTTFNPPFYVEARIFKQRRNIFNPGSKEVELGDFTEYTVEEVRSNWEKLRDELEKKIREAEERAKWRASHGSKIVAIMPLSSQKSGIDSQYKEIIDNPDLSSTIRGQLTVAKVSYDVSYDTLMTAVEAKDKLDNPTESDVQEVYGLLGSYESELDNVAELLEKATESISKNYTDDHIDEVNRELDEASRRIDEARDDINRARSDLDTAQEELDQTKIDLEDSRNRLRGAEDNLRETRDDLSKLESDLREAENSLRDKVDLVDYNERITDITRDMASKVDGEWVDGRLRVEIDGESELIYVKDDIDGMINNTVSKAKYETDQEGIVERFESAESRIYQNEQAIGGMVKQIDYNADQGRLEERLTEWERTADGFNQSVSRLQTDFDNLEIGGRNLIRNSERYVLTPRNTGQSSDNYNYAMIYLVDGVSLINGQKYTGSANVEITHGNFDRITVLSRKEGNTTNASLGHIPIVNGRIEFTFTANGEEALFLFYAGVSGETRGNGVIFTNVKIEKGNKATDWTPAPEDQISYTETRIQQLADEISLTYAKNNELIAGIRIGDPNPINGANVEITGDTAIYGRLLAPDATFIKISTEEMYAIDAEIKDSKITGKLDANEALFQKGKFEEAHLIKAKIEEADIIDADIQNATITGSLNSVGGTFTGRLEGVDGTFTGELIAATGTFRGNMTAGSITSNTTIDVTTDLRVGNNIYLGENFSTAMKGIGFNSSGGSIYTGIRSIYQGAIMNLELVSEGYVRVSTGNAGMIVDSQISADRLVTVSTLEYTVNNHAYIRPRPGYELRVADVNGTWRPVKADSFPAMSSELYKTNIAPYKESALELLRESVVYDYERIATGKRELGFIIERETPEVLKYDEESINTYALGSLAVKGIQELDTKVIELDNKFEDEISWLKTKNQMQENEIKKLKHRVKQLEELIA